jgi:chemotaxis protein CheD
MGEAIMVGLAEIKFTQSQDDVLIALGLGSCISVCAYDPEARIAAMAHVVLPESTDNDSAAGKFADTAIPHLLESFAKLGASAERIRVALAGGAQLFAFHGTGVRLEIGTRNSEAVKAALEKARLTVVATDLGGSAGRTVHLTGDGRMRVKVIGKTELELVHLGQAKRAAAAAPPGVAVQTVSRVAPGLDSMRRT